ncbi:MAG: MaoC family dehydratase N-terminal domain-containing protein [Dehalococcoidales bacterium]|nr:MaoC family dehydratase N-terminal domain-containing protein [Dehalococcoidales bacterium]MDZ4230724.1 MaoC family dehydratase N-terminal domain-containing protein [Dehalococcoidales bacterium]
MAKANLITTLEEFEAERRKGIGTVLPPTGMIKEASLDNIRSYTDGIGDYNPLWRDEAYAGNSRFGAITAPPNWVFSPSIGAGVASNGIIPRERLSNKYFPINYAGGEMEWFRPIWVGDKIYVKETVGDVQNKQSQRLGPILLCSGLTQFYNQRRELVATLNAIVAKYLNIGRAMNYDRTPKGEVVGEPPDPLVWERTRRGAETRYWEDVKEGEELPTLKKGTFTEKEVFFWFLVCRGHGSNRAKREETEGTTYLATGHLDHKYSVERRNMPGMFADGPHTSCWLMQIATDWMGDDGALKKFRFTVRHPNVVGDVNTVFAKVLKKYVENGEHLVDIDIKNLNQAELPTLTGSATVILPSRG